MMFLLALTLITAQSDTLTLERAYLSAYESYPRAREMELSLRIRDLRLRNMDTRFLPALSLGGQAVYQSDLPSIPISAPGLSVPTVSHDQYRFGLSVDQLLYDGGATSAQREIEVLQAEVANQDVAVASYGLREQVETAWFAVLLSEAEVASLDVYVSDVRARLNQTQSRFDRGVSTRSNVDVLEAELIRIEQRRDAARSRRRGGLDVLEILTGWTLADDAVLAGTVADVPASDVATRPEKRLFELTRRNLESQTTLVSRSTRPRVSSFVDAAVGRPQGLDMFQNTFGPFVSMGVRINWSFWDWNSSGRDQEVLMLQTEGIRAQEDAFDQQIAARAAQVRRDIERLGATLDGDAAIIKLRAGISAEALSRFNNGVITATDYLVERNAEHRARLEEQVHRIQLAQAKARLATILGAL